MTGVRYLTLLDVLELHRRVVTRTGGSQRLRDLGALEAAMTAQFNIVVRGDSTMSTVKVRAEFTKTGKSNWICPSKNTFETRLQARVKAKAEAR